MKATVTEVIHATPSVVLLRLKTEQSIDFKPGQFISVNVEHQGRKVMKPYSIASSPHIRDHIELCIKVVRDGNISNYMANLKPNDTIEFNGPFGHLTLQEEINNDLVFIATGTGISALKPMIELAFNRGISHDVWLFFGVRTEKDIIYKKDFEALALANEYFHFVPVLSKSDDLDYEHGHVQDAFKKLIRPGNQDIYICGLYMMVDELKQLCKQLYYPDSKVHYEKYV